MRQLGQILLAVLLVAGSTVLAQTQTQTAPLKIGYVDSEVIFQQFPEAIKAKGELEAYSKGLSDKLDSMSKALQQDYADFQKQENTMPEAKKNEKRQRILDAQQNIEEFRRGAQNNMLQKQESVMAPVKEKIMKAIEQIAKDEAMQFVFDKPEQAILLYADSSFDITFKVLDKLKRGK